MEKVATKQVKYGRSCVRCKSYFVTDEEGAHLCPWCVNAEAGPSVAESYEFPNSEADTANIEGI